MKLSNKQRSQYKNTIIGEPIQWGNAAPDPVPVYKPVAAENPIIMLSLIVLSLWLLSVVL